MGLCCSRPPKYHDDDDEEYMYYRRQLKQKRQTRQHVEVVPTITRNAPTMAKNNPKGPARRAAPLSAKTSRPHDVVPVNSEIRLEIVVPKAATQQLSISCEACGEYDHAKAVCRYRERHCFYCRKEGHIIKICPAKKRQRQRKQVQFRRHQQTKKRF